MLRAGIRTRRRLSCRIHSSRVHDEKITLHLFCIHISRTKGFDTCMMKRSLPLLALVPCFLLLHVGPCEAACHVITPTGSGSLDGSNWSNACAGFTGSCSPASLVRGDSYYLGSGTYVGGVTLNTAASGSTLITIKGANAGDHCTDTGWSSGLDTGSSPAHFVSDATWSGSGSGNGTNWVINTSNWKIDGNNCPVNEIKKQGQGIFIDNSAYRSTTASQGSGILVDSRKAGGVGNITVRCVEIQGMGMGSDGDAADFVDLSSIACNSSGTQATVTLNGPTRWFGAQTAPDGSHMPASQVTITGVPSGNFNAAHVLVSGTPSSTQFTYPVSCTPNASASSGHVRGAYAWGGLGGDMAVYIGMPASPIEGSYTFSYMSIHDAMACVQINGGSPNGVFDHDYCARNFYIAPDHSAGWTLEESSGSTYTISNSVFTDVESTAWIVDLYGANVVHQYIYGNVFSYSPGNMFHRNGVGNAVFSCINSNTTCDDVHIYNNTVANVTGGQLNNQSGALAFLEPSDASASAWSIENNLIYNSKSGGLTGGATPSGAVVVDYNTYINLTAGSGDGGSHSYRLSGVADPFVNDSGFNYALISDTVVAHLNDGISLSSPFNVDMSGATRGSGGAWDRGALQFASGGLEPPTAVTALVN